MRKRKLLHRPPDLISCDCAKSVGRLQHSTLLSSCKVTSERKVRSEQEGCLSMKESRYRHRTSLTLFILTVFCSDGCLYGARRTRDLFRPLQGPGSQTNTKSLQDPRRWCRLSLARRTGHLMRTFQLPGSAWLAFIFRPTGSFMEWAAAAPIRQATSLPIRLNTIRTLILDYQVGHLPRQHGEQHSLRRAHRRRDALHLLRGRVGQSPPQRHHRSRLPL